MQQQHGSGCHRRPNSSLMGNHKAIERSEKDLDSASRLSCSSTSNCNTGSTIRHLHVVRVSTEDQHMAETHALMISLRMELFRHMSSDHPDIKADFGLELQAAAILLTNSTAADLNCLQPVELEKTQTKLRDMALLRAEKGKPSEPE